VNNNILHLGGASPRPYGVLFGITSNSGGASPRPYGAYVFPGWMKNLVFSPIAPLLY